MTVQFPQWYRIKNSDTLVERTATNILVYRRASGYNQVAPWGLAHYIQVESGDLIPTTADEADRILHPENHEWVVQDRVPARVGVDRCYWAQPGTNPTDGIMWRMSSERPEAIGKKHGDKHPCNTLVLHVKCLRKDLPKTRTVTLYEWLCWDEGGDEELIFSVGPPVETSTRYGYKHYVKTGRTREVEVPV